MPMRAAAKTPTEPGTLGAQMGIGFFFSLLAFPLPNSGVTPACIPLLLVPPVSRNAFG